MRLHHFHLSYAKVNNAMDNYFLYWRTDTFRERESQAQTIPLTAEYSPSRDTHCHSANKEIPHRTMELIGSPSSCSQYPTTLNPTLRQLNPAAWVQWSGFKCKSVFVAIYNYIKLHVKCISVYKIHINTHVRR